VARTPCAFCESRSKKITNEHIFAEWIGAVVGAGRAGVIVRNTFNLDETIRPAWHTQNLDLRVRMACESCNTGWMSNLETEVRPIMMPMIRGNAKVPLTLRGQRAVATWAVKTAMVAEFLQKPPTRYFTQAERRFLVDEVVPSRNLGAFVWIGRYASKDNGLHGLATTMTQADRVSRAHLSMFALGQFAIQVLVERGAVGQRERLAVRPGPWDQLLSQIWPPPTLFGANGGLFFWPPPSLITAGNAGAIFDRFLAFGVKRGPDRPRTSV